MKRMKMRSRDVIGSNISKIGELFPHCVTERKDENGELELAVDFEKLQQELSDDIIGKGEERYQFTWPDKRKANREANVRTTATLRPCREESVDFDNTENLYIEGDNLEVLKVLRETYLGKVKMIYIDPPYNTGNDFVYNDDFAQGKGEFEQSSGLFDEEGNLIRDPMQRNTESNGRFRCAGELKNKGAELVVALSHLGYKKDSDADYYDRGIASNTRNIDCIIGGHTHTFLTRADYVTNLAGRQVPIVQTGCKGIYLGEMKVAFSSGEPKFSYRLIPVNARLDKRVDRNFQAQIDYYTNLLEESMNEVLAYCPNTMRKGTPEALLSNFTADAVYDICTEYFGEEPDLAIYNNGGIRAEMPAGDVTRGTVYSIYPFDNTLTLIEIKGSDLLEAFNGIATYGGEPVSSSVKLTIKDKSVYSLEIGGEPVQNDRTYKVATINYLIDATNYLSALRNYTSRRESGVYIYELISDYVKSLGDQGIQLSSQLDGRVTVI